MGTGTVVVTGASGFIGRHLVPVLTTRGHDVVQAGRRAAAAGGRFVQIGDIGGDTDWNRALEGAAVVVHLAGVAHGKARSETEYASVNAAGTGRLCEAAKAAGVRAIVNVSSIAARDVARGPARLATYARSKLEAEDHVVQFANSSGATGISLRPPLVYGWDAPANWRLLQRLAASGLPLPFESVSNRRSFCAVENLCDAVAMAVGAGLEGKGSGVYEVADQETLALPEVIKHLRTGMNLPFRLVAVPPHLLTLAARIAGRTEVVRTLLSDLVVSPQRFMQAFGWAPTITAADAIARSGRLFRSNR